MKAIEHYFHVLLFIMLYKVVLTFKSVDVTIQMKATVRFFHLILFVITDKIGLNLNPSIKP